MTSPLQLAASRKVAREAVAGQVQDSGIGYVTRDTLTGPTGGRISTLETYYEFWLDWVTDPDAALQNDPLFLERGMANPYVRAAMNKRSLTLATLPVTFQPSDARNIDRDLAQKVSDYVSDVWRLIPDKHQLYSDLIEQSVWGGGHGIEFVWDNYEGALVPRQWFPVHKSRLVFDRQGNMALLTRQQPIWGSYINQAPTSITSMSNVSAIATPMGKFIYHKYKSKGGTWYRPLDEGYFYYGQGEDRWLYTLITFDAYALGYWMKWLERFATPTAMMTYNMADPNARNYAIQAMQQLKNGAVVAMPYAPQAGANGIKQFELAFQEASSLGYDAYFNFTTQYVKPRVNEILLGGAESMQTGETGSFGANVEQKNAGENVYFAYDALNLDSTFNRFLIPAIVQARFGGIPEKYYPRHAMTPEKVRDRKGDMELLQLAASLVPIREDDVYDTIGKKRPKEDPITGEIEPHVFMGQQGNPMDDPLGMIDPMGNSMSNEPGNEPPKKLNADALKQPHDESKMQRLQGI